MRREAVKATGSPSPPSVHRRWRDAAPASPCSSFLSLPWPPLLPLSWPGVKLLHSNPPRQWIHSLPFLSLALSSRREVYFTVCSGLVPPPSLYALGQKHCFSAGPLAVTGGSYRYQASTIRPLWTRGWRDLGGRLDFEPGPIGETEGENPIRQWSES